MLEEHTGLEMTRMLASGEASAAALARSRTIEALVLKRSVEDVISSYPYAMIAADDAIHTITGHAGLAGNTGRDEDDLGALESITEARLVRLVARDGAVGVDVAKVGSDT
jgi:hypothetical protein